MRRAGPFLLGFSKYDSVAPTITRNTDWFLPENLYEYEILKLTFSIIAMNGATPFCQIYLDLNTYLGIIRYTRNNSYLHHPHSNSVNIKYSVRKKTRK